LIFHSKLPKTKVQNLEWIRSSLLKPGEQEPFPDFFKDATRRLAQELSLSRTSVPLNDHCESFDSRCGYPEGTGLRAARMLMQEKVIQIDLNIPKLESIPLAALRIALPDLRLKLAGGM